jgi:cell division protease FtsH
MNNPHDNTDIRHSALKPLAVLAAGMTGADIERLVRELRGRCRRRGVPFTWTALQEALLAGSNLPSSSIALPIAVHEIGHAVAYEELGIGTVETIRIGGTHGGETRTRLRVDAVQTEQGAMKWIACLLAGRTAETLIFGSAMIGAGGFDESDLARATELALKLESAFGTAEEMPLLYRPPTNAAETLNYNPALAARVNRRLEAAETIARDLLTVYPMLLARMAARLAEQVVIDGGELRREIAAAKASG